MKKGFTLVELLAVIVILSIIALITIPVISNVIEKARSGAAIQSANGLIDAAKKNKITEIINGSDISRYDFPNDTKLNYKGTKPDKGTILINEEGKTSATFLINGYCVRKRFSENSVKIIQTDNCVIEDSELLLGSNYTESILNGADPVLKENLIPVIIEDDGKVKKANLKKEWYSYQNKKWANAVILKDESIIYKDNEVIPETNIESYFVWIPRYKYKIFNEGNYTSTTGTSASNASITTIDIVFESKDKSISNGSKKESWLTHPAFTSFNVNGIWVGKFETGYDGATSASTAEIDSSDSNKVIVKPNVYSWRGISVSNIFKAAYSYKREMDSHMMKNTEWGAVAYLSHSKYGINKEVNINNNSSYKTGYSALLTTDQTSFKGTYGDSSSYNTAYNTSIGYLASTTGNITGVYDMSGGAYEYMASYRDTTLGSSGFTTDAISTYNSKYFDVYSSSSTITSYNNRILGDATGEMGPFNRYEDKDKTSRNHNSWYADRSDFVDSSYPWFHRSGGYTSGVLAGQFDFDRYTGGAYTSIGFRLVLS